MRPEEGDGFELHAWDTVKAPDFPGGPGRGGAVRRASPANPPAGALDPVVARVRTAGSCRGFFGGIRIRACIGGGQRPASSRCSALSNNLVKYNNFKRYAECFVTSLLLEGVRFAG